MEGEDRPASCICNVSFPTRGVAKHSCYFPQLRQREVRRILLLGTSVNKGKKRKDRARRRRSGVLVENKDSGPPFGQDESVLLSGKRRGRHQAGPARQAIRATAPAM